MIQFPFSDYWWLYLGFSLFVLFMLALDLGIFHRKARVVSVKSATGWTVTWISLALFFNLLFYFYCLNKFGSSVEGLARSKQLALEFLAGFVVEKSLAIDNIFVFAIVFEFFVIKPVYQHRVLFFGIAGALLFRAVFIGLGSELLKYHSLVIFFGVLLVLTGLKMMFSGVRPINPESSWILRGIRKFIPIDSTVEGEQFLIVRNGRRWGTRLLMALIFIEFTDILFAVDSVPAIFALTSEPLIVFTSNIFAILGLRSMYFMLSSVLLKFRYIKYGLAAVLVFVGLKMAWLNQVFDGKFPILWSLCVISFLVGTSILYSWLRTRREAERHVHSL